MKTKPLIFLPEDRYFDPDPQQKKLAQRLYQSVASLPLVCPHGHVDPRMFADPDFSFGTPVDLLIIPDHYAVRMLYSQGIPMEDMGVPRKDGGRVETDHRKIWQTFADHFYLFRGTPTGLWLVHELRDIFDVQQKLTSQSAQEIYDQIAEKLACPEYQPRELYQRFNIEVLCTTEPATDTLEHHQVIRTSGWSGKILPTLRPDAILNIGDPDWPKNLGLLGEVSGIEASSYAAYIQAIEQRRAYFKGLGATATDHAVNTPYTEQMERREAEVIFERARKGEATPEDAVRFNGHMLMEMARMSIEDGLVMQIHPGSLRNYSESIYASFGPDKGADIPVPSEFTRNLQPLLNQYGHDSRLTIILFTLDETTYSRELAPLAGVFPALKLGPPWWFYDSLNGVQRYFDNVVETAGLYNTCGFNDDTRAFCSIPARHDLWRRASANWIAGLVARGVIDMDDAMEMVVDASYRLARKAYKL